MRIPEEMPPFFLVARGRPSYNPDFGDWQARLPFRRSAAIALRVMWAAKTAHGTTGTGNCKHAIRHGFPVAIWTPPGEWRTARTIGQLAEIIAAGGEIETPKDSG